MSRMQLDTVKVVLISTYELGHQPFGLASPAAWLRARGANVTCLDLSREPLREEAIREADFIGIYVPMHTATRLGVRLIEPLRALSPRARLCAYGLYAPVNEDYLRSLGVETIVGGEFEQALVEAVESAASLAGNTATRQEVKKASIFLDRLEFVVPDRTGLPSLKRYAHLVLADGRSRVAGYTEASRGCKHLCRHCPIVPVYNGVFRVVPREVVLADIRQQVAAGAEHITFGDPDFFNGPAHVLAIVGAMHEEFPGLSYDVTIKIEHLLRHSAHLEVLRDTGCLFVTTAVESVDDAVLERLDKGHTRGDFLAVIQRFRALDMTLQPTFVPFTPWTTLEGYRDLLTVIGEHGLIESVTPIQLGIRLLIPSGSRLLELDEVRRGVGPFDAAGLLYRWEHSDPRVDSLALRVQELAAQGDKLKRSRAETFTLVWQAAAEAAGASSEDAAWRAPAASGTETAPRLSEPWYCCAEPTQDQFVPIGSVAEAPAAHPSVTGETAFL
jgi:radical SAM superfamily enzyme YgiQ (UPF0313 family)